MNTCSSLDRCRCWQTVNDVRSKSLLRLDWLQLKSAPFLHASDKRASSSGYASHRLHALGGRCERNPPGPLVTAGCSPRISWICFFATSAAVAIQSKIRPTACVQRESNEGYRPDQFGERQPGSEFGCGQRRLFRSEQLFYRCTGRNLHDQSLLHFRFIRQHVGRDHYH